MIGKASPALCMASVMILAAFAQNAVWLTATSVGSQEYAQLLQVGPTIGFPDKDPDSGKFLGQAGHGLSTLAGQRNNLYLGIPAGRTTFTVSIFDGDGDNNWDGPNPPIDQLDFKLYKDALKNGAMTLKDSWTDSGLANDAWTDKTYSVDNDAKAPSGNYFYRIEVNWHDPASANDISGFKLKVEGQISVVRDQPFCIEGAPISILDPGLGSGDPNPGEQNDPNANSYDGYWLFYFYVPSKTDTMRFKDGDFDRSGDTDDPNTPNTDPDGPGPAQEEGAHDGQPADDGGGITVSPSVRYRVTDPGGSVFDNNNPSGNQEWENFIISDDATLSPDHLTSKPLNPGLWKVEFIGLDAHNLACLSSPYEVFPTDDPPLPVYQPPKVAPDRTATVFVPPAQTLSFAHNVTNPGAAQVFDLTATSAHGWQTRIYHDVNGNGKLDTGEPRVNDTGLLGQNITYQIIAQVDVPALTSGTVDITKVLASSQLEWAVQGWALDTITVITNRPPVAEANGPYSGFENSAIILDGSGSYDPDNDSLQYRWDFNNDGIWDTLWGTSPTVRYTWGDDWSGTIALEVSDGNLTDTDTATVSIMNVLPSGTLTITTSSQEEGNPITFSAHVTDPGSDDIFLRWVWGFGAPDEYSTYYNGAGPDPYPSPDIHPRDITDVKSHTYGDNGIFVVKVYASDDDSGTQSATFQISATPGNLPPSVSMSGSTNVDEGQMLTLTATATDPGTDDLTFIWAFELGPTKQVTYYNDGIGPDPPNSPSGTYPFTAADSASHVYGDNGAYTMTLAVIDDDGGQTTYQGVIVVNNLPPSIQPFGPFVVDEGLPLEISANASDPGSDDLTFSWTFELIGASQNTFYNDGANPDPPKSPDGVFPFSTADTTTAIYGDNGVYLVTLSVMDDDGASTTMSTEVTVMNVKPSIEAFGPFAVDEGMPLAVSTIAMDPGSDDLTFTWSFEYGPDFQIIYYNDGIGPDPAKSPMGIFPFTAQDTVMHTYGDNGIFTLSLTVEDDDGGAAFYETAVTVRNVAPTIENVEAFIVANMTLRVAGEKWHDVRVNLFTDGVETGFAQVVRYPGSPDDQSATLHDVKVSLTRKFWAVVYYTPEDDPVNGQPNGANPVWLIVDWENGNQTRLHHTFNVRHNGTYVWTVDNFQIFALNQNIHLAATASDPGSDDLEFVWESSDGRTFSTITYNDGSSPDPYPSPEVNPITAESEVIIVYYVSGTYSINLTVTDDDGGTATYSLILTVGS